jgi:hypothetical protein
MDEGIHARATPGGAYLSTRELKVNANQEAASNGDAIA